MWSALLLTALEKTACLQYMFCYIAVLLPHLRCIQFHQKRAHHFSPPASAFPTLFQSNGQRYPSRRFLPGLTTSPTEGPRVMWVALYQHIYIWRSRHQFCGAKTDFLLQNLKLNYLQWAICSRHHPGIDSCWFFDALHHFAASFRPKWQVKRRTRERKAPVRFIQWTTTWEQLYHTVLSYHNDNVLLPLPETASVYKSELRTTGPDSFFPFMIRFRSPPTVSFSPLSRNIPFLAFHIFLPVLGRERGFRCRN